MATVQLAYRAQGLPRDDRAATTRSMEKTPHLVSLGCRLNAYEVERMGTLAKGFDGETVVVNTCAVTNEAVRQSRQVIRRAARAHPEARIVVSGCAASLDPEGFTQLAGVTHVIPNEAKLNPGAWRRLGAREQAPGPLSAVMARAPLEIQNGCDHQCTFCIIPQGRGVARSVPPTVAVAEAQKLADAGAREIVLTGVDLTSYGPDLGAGVSLADPIIALLEALPDTVRIRLSSIDGAEVDERLFELVTSEERIAPYLHLSLQSGDDMILKRMKRRHSRSEAVRLTQALRAARPEIAFGADLIAGFPTETDEMFENTCALIAEAGLSYVHVFPFSPRVGTPAARMPQLDRQTIKARAARLRAAADAALERHLLSKVGQCGAMLVETSREGRRSGKLADFTEVLLAGEGPTHREEQVEITGIEGGRLTALPLREGSTYAEERSDG